MRRETLLKLLDRAAAEPLGLYIETNNPKSLREKHFQAIRQHHPSPEVRRLIFAIPSIPNTLFICQPTIELETEPEWQGDGPTQS